MSLVVPSMIWVDVETTGLDESRGRILELGLMTTDSDLNVQAKVSWVFPADRDWLPIFEDEALKMHTASGLLFECFNKHKAGAYVLRNEILRWMDSRVGQEKLPMCGSTIGFDRRWIANHLPDLAARFHYRNIDVSTLKNLARLWYPHIPEWTGGRKLHRVLPDLEDSIAELKFYRETIMASALQVLDSNERPLSPDGVAAIAREAMAQMQSLLAEHDDPK